MPTILLLLLLPTWLGAQSIEQRFDLLLEQCRVARHASRFHDAEGLCREAGAVAKAWPPGAIRHLRWQNELSLALVWLARYAEAEAILETALPLARRSSPQDYLAVAVNLGAIYRVRGRLRDAGRLVRAALRVEGSEGLPDALVARSLLAGIEARLGAYKAAQHLYEDILAAQTRVLGPAHPETLATLDEFTWLAIRRGRYPEAERLARQYVEDSRLTHVPGHPALAFGHHHLGMIYTKLGRLNEAGEELDRAMAILDKSVGQNDPHMAMALLSAARLDYRRRDLGRARQRVEQAISIIERSLGPTHPSMAVCQRTYSDILRRLRERRPAREALARANSIAESNARAQGVGQSIDVRTLRLESGR